MKLISEDIWKVASDVNCVIWTWWEDKTVVDMNDLRGVWHLDRAPTYEILSSIWRDGLEQSSHPNFT